DAGDGARREPDRKAGPEARPAPVLDQHDLASIRPAPHPAQQMAVVVGDVDDMESARPLIDREGLGPSPRDLRVRRKVAEALALVVLDDDAIVLAHDDAVAGLLDDLGAAGTRGLAPLRAQLLDIGDALLAALLPRPVAELRLLSATAGLTANCRLAANSRLP